MLDNFPLFDLTLRHIELCNCVISHILVHRNPPKTCITVCVYVVVIYPLYRLYRTEAGLELHMATNYLGCFLLCQAGNQIILHYKIIPNENSV